MGGREQDWRQDNQLECTDGIAAAGRAPHPSHPWTSPQTFPTHADDFLCLLRLWPQERASLGQEIKTPALSHLRKTILRHVPQSLSGAPVDWAPVVLSCDPLISTVLMSVLISQVFPTPPERFPESPPKETTCTKILVLGSAFQMTHLRQIATEIRKKEDLNEDSCLMVKRGQKQNMELEGELTCLLTIEYGVREGRGVSAASRFLA